MSIDQSTHAPNTRASDTPAPDTGAHTAAGHAGELFACHGVIDVDTHLTEPPDVWTARVPTSVQDQVPHIERIDGKDVWMVSGERRLLPASR